jgi:hypothetical protein
VRVVAALCCVLLGCGGALDTVNRSAVESTADLSPVDVAAVDFGACAVSQVAGCTPARFLLSCGLAGGGGEICLSDNASACPPSNEGVYTPCSNLCQGNEYALDCHDSPPPASCHLTAPNPGESQFYCCPCS